jgi:uncharacterized protein (DUF1697 family)
MLLTVRCRHDTEAVMTLVVFLRGVNVGGSRVFRPALLARELAEYDVVNVGAAGTFVVHKPIRPAALKTEILRRLPFDAQAIVCPAKEIVQLVQCEPFPKTAAAKDAQRFVSVLGVRLRSLPKFPIDQPAGDQWQVRIITVVGRFALSLWRKLGRTMLYPNSVVEKTFHVPATTRNWNTISRIGEILHRGSRRDE